MRLSDNFTLDELIDSQIAERTGIDNVPDHTGIVDNLRALCLNILQPARAAIMKPIIISSGYRCPELNKIVGSEPTSQHLKGEAADLVVHGYSALTVARLIEKSGVPYDQLIQEGTWTHVSYVANGKNRQEVLTARFKGGKAHYSRGLA